MSIDLIQKLPKSARIACIYGARLGDGLIGMTLSHYCQENGYDIVSFSDSAYELRSLFPDFDIRPVGGSLEHFDYVIYPHQSPIDCPNAPERISRIIFREHPLYAKRLPLRETFALFCRDYFGFENIEGWAPLIIPDEWALGKYVRRIVIHPTACEAFRCWGKKRFLKLAHRLENSGYEPVFIMSPKEKEEWGESAFETHAFEGLFELATFIAESGFFIGGDSGPGHLAAILQRPTLTLAYRWGVIARWMPSHDVRRILLPWPILMGAKLRQRFWRYFISPRRCHRRFLSLLRSL